MSEYATHSTDLISSGPKWEGGWVLGVPCRLILSAECESLYRHLRVYAAMTMYYRAQRQCISETPQRHRTWVVCLPLDTLDAFSVFL